MAPHPDMRVLDLGGGDGSHIAEHLPFLRNVVVADILEDRLAVARERFGYQTVLLTEDAPTLPFDDAEFDIVFCSSVIEHVTGPKAWVRRCRSSRDFEESATAAQAQFAAEVARVGRGYWVQTPSRHFPIEAHSALPLPILWLPRSIQRQVNKRWVKKVLWDFRPLSARDMKALFPSGSLYLERWGGLVKSITSYQPPLPREIELDVRQRGAATTA